ncbi:Protein of unknown function [Tistlia consotensis]|uniref:DUF1232 domain-containing protein n=1 Tax=Tistlia consotensis USBA 355 TaxID=560819 RepID=A0A1Y6BPV0_9PROT|nr:YkvA family protein [Tistlia consotensis]SMF14398.1 Protein of unknown function [Tistlia consotensis USBA 355]SNR49584.1 Protein of unknown function [Tistlia consotensis]
MASPNSPSRRHRLRDLPLKGGQKALKRVLRARRDRVRRGRTKRIGALLLTLALLAYGASPVDLIPDRILGPVPLLGWLDDLVVLPLGFWLVARLLRGAERERHAARRLAAGLVGADLQERRHERLRSAVLIVLGTALGVAAGLVVQRLLGGPPPGG